MKKTLLLATAGLGALLLGGCNQSNQGRAGNQPGNGTGTNSGASYSAPATNHQGGVVMTKGTNHQGGASMPGSTNSSTGKQ